MTGKKAVFFLLVVGFSLFFAIFRLSDTSGYKQQTGETYRYVIGVSQPNLTEPWRIAMNKEIREEVAKHPDIHIIFTDAAQSSERQIRDVENLMGYGIDLLIISLDDPVALTSTVSNVYRNIPVIVLGRGVTGYDYSLYVGTDDEMIGRKAGEYARQILGNTGKVLEVQGLKGSPTVEERSRGFLESVGGTGIEIVQTINADWQRDKAEDLVTKWLTSNREADLIFAHNEAMALGAYKAAEHAGSRDVKIIGIDGIHTDNGSRQLVTNNQLTGMITSPTGGKEAIRYAIDILRKEKGVPKKVILRSQKITMRTTGETLADAPAIMSAATDADRPITLGFAQVGMESGWRVAHNNSVIQSAEDAGINLIYDNADQSQEKQIEIIRSFIARKVDVIAFSPKIATGWEEVLRESKQAGIPVILSDRKVDVSDDTLWTAYIGSDFREEGRRAARWLAGQAKTGKHYRIVELQGTPESAPATGRKIGFEEAIQGDPRFTIIRSMAGDFTKSKGKALMQQVLRDTGNGFDVVYCHNDDMALGAIEAIEEYGLKPGKDIMLISVDATKSALQALIVGKLNFVVECNPLLGPQLMKAVKDLAEGKELPMEIITSEGTFTREEAKKVINIRDY
jgi:galactofuranose transport system substrate-binding protein